MQINIPIIIISLVFVTLVIFVWAFGPKYLKNQDIQGCMEVSKYTVNDTTLGVSTTTPMDDYYKRCMKEKGYK